MALSSAWKDLSCISYAEYKRSTTVYYIHTLDGLASYHSDCHFVVRPTSGGHMLYGHVAGVVYTCKKQEQREWLMKGHDLWLCTYNAYLPRHPGCDQEVGSDGMQSRTPLPPCPPSSSRFFLRHAQTKTATTAETLSILVAEKCELSYPRTKNISPPKHLHSFEKEYPSPNPRIKLETMYKLFHYSVPPPRPSVSIVAPIKKI